MTEEERLNEIELRFNYNLPIKWPVDSDWYEVRYESYGDVSSGGVYVYVKKNEGSEVQVSYTNDEWYGSSIMSVTNVKQRIYDNT
jgi:hypothetical protein